MARLTPQKKKFLDHWFKHGSVPDACKHAKYSQSANGYKVLRQDSNGVYEDESVRQYLAHLAGLTDSPVKRPTVDKSQVRPSPNIIAFPTPKEGENVFVPSVDDVLRLLWAMAQDPDISSGPRVQAAATLLKDLRGTPTETEVAPEDVVASMKAALGVG